MPMQDATGQNNKFGNFLQGMTGNVGNMMMQRGGFAPPPAQGGQGQAPPLTPAQSGAGLHPFAQYLAQQGFTGDDAQGATAPAPNAFHQFLGNFMKNLGSGMGGQGSSMYSNQNNRLM